MSVKLKCPNLAKVDKELTELSKKKVRVGVVGTGEVDGVPVVEYAVKCVPSLLAI